MADVGINLTMTENVSTVAPKIAESLRSVGQAGQDMQDALELGDLESQYKAFADRTDKMYDMQKEGERSLAQRLGGGKAGISQLEKQAPQIIKTGGGAIAQAGQGDAVGGVGGMLGGLQGMVSGMGPVGMAIGVLAAGLFAINAVAKGYEEMVPTLLDVNSNLGELSGTAAENTNTIRKNMTEMGEAAAEFGFGLEVANETIKTLATRGGLGRDEAFAGAENIYAYARAYGVAPGRLGEAQALTQRFGAGNVLGVAAGGIEQQGMAPGMYQEFLNATMTIFEEGLSRGIVKGVEEIGTTQAWIGQMGEAFQGQYGLNLYRKMEGAVVGATALSSEQDIIMFRAAQKIVGKEGGFVPVMKYMEAGINPEYFEAIRSSVEKMTGGNFEGMVKQFKQMFGINWIAASELVGLDAAKAVKVIGKGKLEQPDSNELNMLKLQAEIAADVKKISSRAADVKLGMTEGVEKIVNAIGELVEGKAEKRIIREQRQEFNASEIGIQAKENIGKLSGASVLSLQMTRASGGKFGKAAQEAGSEIARLMANLTDAQLQELSDSGIFKTIRKATWENISPSEISTDPRTGRTVETPSFVPEELPIALEKLIIAIDGLNATREREQQINVNVESGGLTEMGGS